MSQKESLSRISISLPESLLEGLDDMVARRGFDSRSQAICDMVNREINDHKSQSGRDVMTGTLNLVYNHSTPGLHKKLYDLQYKYLDEIISNLSVNLTDTNTMAVLVVQGPADKLQMVADQIISLRGVAHGKLLLNSYTIPPIHPFAAPDTQS